MYGFNQFVAESGELGEESIGEVSNDRWKRYRYSR